MRISSGEFLSAAKPEILSIKEATQFEKDGQLPPDSAPLYGAPLVVNVHAKSPSYGDITTKATPVVGDYGPPRLTPQGLSFGSQVSAQSLGSALTADTPTIDANARYVWAAKRGLQRGDSIETTDIPMMEAMRKEMYMATKPDELVQDWQKRGITLTQDGEEHDLPTSLNEIDGMIRGAKDDLIHDIIEKNPDLPADAVANRANVPESYISNNFKATAP